MHKRSFYVSPDNTDGKSVLLKGKEAHHLASVVRSKPGDVIFAVDGCGTCYSVELTEINTKSVKGRVLKVLRGFGEPVTEVTLAAGIVKGSRFDWIVEKATELGVKRIIPFISENSVVSGSNNKLTRWRRIAMSAMKQSLRSAVPEVTEVVPLTRVLTGRTGSVRIIAVNSPVSVDFNQLRARQTSARQKVIVVVGPEGGFTQQEVDEAVDQSFIPVTLGQRRLRTETAAVTVLSIIFNMFGEMR